MGESRGGQDGYKYGDFTRGLVSTVPRDIVGGYHRAVSTVKQEVQNRDILSGYQFGDITRGVVARIGANLPQHHADIAASTETADLDGQELILVSATRSQRILGSWSLSGANEPNNETLAINSSGDGNMSVSGWLGMKEVNGDLVVCDDWFTAEV